MPFPRPLRTLLAALALPASMAASLPLLACGGPGGGSGGTTAAARGAVRGPVTFENRSSASVCHLELDLAGAPNLHVPAELPSGTSTTFEVSADVDALWVTECGAARMLVGTPAGRNPGPNRIDGLPHARVVLYDAGAAPASPTDHLALVVAPIGMDEWLDAVVPHLVRGGFADGTNQDPLRAEAFDVLRETAQQRSWPETFLAFRMVSPDWYPVRHRATGVITGRSVSGFAASRFPDGHCQIHTASFQQAHDGSDFDGPLRFDGVGPNVFVPCALAAHLASRPDFAR